MNNLKDTADRLLGICDDWTVSDIQEHLQWLINNPDEIANGYDKTTFTWENEEAIMEHVREMIKQ